LAQDFKRYSPAGPKPRVADDRIGIVEKHPKAMRQNALQRDSWSFAASLIGDYWPRPNTTDLFHIIWAKTELLRLDSGWSVLDRWK
jgi:hypothetical protein